MSWASRLRRLACSPAITSAAGKPLARDVGEHEARAARTQIEKVVVVASHRAGLHAAGRALERAQRRGLLGQQLALDLPRQLDLVGGAPLHLDTVRHLLGEPDVVEGDGGLAPDRREKLLVLARIGILGQPCRQHDQARQPSVASQDRDQAIGIDRARRSRQGGALGPRARHLPRPPAPGKIGEDRQPEVQRLARARSARARRHPRQRAPPRFEEHVDRARMEGARQARHEQRRQLLAARRAAGPFRKVLEDLTRVVRSAEEGMVDAAPHASLQARAGQDERGPEAGAHDDPGRLGSGAEPAAERKGEVRGGRDTADQEEPGEPALHQEVACAPAQEDRDLQHAVLHDRVGERQRDEEQAQHARRPDPEGEVLVGTVPQVVRRRRHGQGREQADQRAPQDHAAPALRGRRSGHRVADERHQAEPEADEVIGHQRTGERHDQAPGQADERLAAAGHQRPRRERQGHGEAGGEPGRLQPGQPPIQRRRGREDREEIKEESGPATVEEDPVGEEEPADERSDDRLDERRARDEAREQERQEPCVPVLHAQEEHRYGDGHEEDGIRAQELLRHPP